MRNTQESLAIVHSPRGVFVYSSQKPQDTFFQEVATKHQYDCEPKIQIHRVPPPPVSLAVLSE